MNYKEFLKRELVPAFGCTEPIAIAYASAKAKEVLEEEPKKIKAILSGNIIKNANSVNVPGTNGRKGIEISIVAGAFLGNSSKELEVLESIDKNRLEECDRFIEDGIVEINLKPNISGLYIEIIMCGEKNNSKVIIEDAHTNITLIEKNGEVLFEKEALKSKSDTVDLDFMKIYEFAKYEDYSDIKEILKTQIDYNVKIAKEGLENDWGSNIGRIILDINSSDYYEKLAAYAAAGSDARMSGCELPVVINSGSGNQGITVSIPVILYAKDNDFSEDEMYRALIFSNLISLYMKENIGKLSAYCGVVSASAAALAGISFLNNDDIEVIKGTISNALAVNSGMVCDGAKASCAMKIASSIRNASLAYRQSLENCNFKAGDGIVKSEIDDTIEVVGNIAKYGMKITDEVVLNEMLGNRDYIGNNN